MALNIHVGHRRGADESVNHNPLRWRGPRDQSPPDTADDTHKLELIF